MLKKYHKLKCKNKILREDSESYLYKTYYREVFRTIYYIIGDKETTKEFVNEAYIKAYNKIETLDDIKNFKPWICVIAANIAKNHIRNNSRVVYIYDYDIENLIEETNLEDIVIDRLERQEQGMLVRESLKRLDGVSKEIIILRYYHNLTYKELAISLDINQGTVKSRLNRAKNKLNNILINLEGNKNG